MMIASLQCGMSVQMAPFATFITAHSDGRKVSAMENAQPSADVVERIFDVTTAVTRLMDALDSPDTQGEGQ